MTEHDAKLFLPKNRPLKAGPDRTAWGRKWDWCMACGAGEYGAHTLTTHEIIGGRGGRSQEPANWLRLGRYPCHDLAEQLDVPREKMSRVVLRELLEVSETARRDLLPKLTLAVQLTLKKWLDPDNWDPMRLTVLHGRRLPEAEPVPAFFLDLLRRHRPELA